MENSISIDQLNFQYPNNKEAILKDVSFEIKDGESVVILGENGSGKSTLFFCMLDLLKKKSGSIKIYDKELTSKNAQELRKKVGLLFQDSTHQLFLPRVKEEIAFAPYNLGLRDEVLDQKISSTLHELGLDDYIDKSTIHLSYGEKKQIAFASIYAMDPEIYLLDEPFISLDPHNRGLLNIILNRIHSRGKTILMISHELDQIPKFIERAIVLHKGEILFDGDIHDLYSRPNILEQANLAVPICSQIFQNLKETDVIFRDVKNPRDVESAIKLLKKYIK